MFDSHYPDTFVALKKDDNENDEEPTRSDTILFLRNRNNSCANWMDSGNYNQAIVTLGATVNLLNRTIAAEKEANTTHRNEDEMISVPGATNNSYSLDDCLDYSAAPSYPIEEFELRFHQWALRIPQKKDVPTTVLLSILTYNLALANHHKAIQRAGPSRPQQTLAKLETSVLLLKRTVRLYQLLLPTDGAGSATSSTTSSNGSQRFTRMVEQNITHLKTYLIQQKQERYETIMEQQKSADDRLTTSTTLSVNTDKKTTTTSTKVKYASMMLQQFIKKNESADRKMVVTSTCSRQRHSGSNDEDEDTDTGSVPSSSSLYEEHKTLLHARYSSSMDPATTAQSSAVDDTTAHGGFRTKFHTAMCTASTFGHLQHQQHHPTPQTKNVQGAYAA